MQWLITRRKFRVINPELLYRWSQIDNPSGVPTKRRDFKAEIWLRPLSRLGLWSGKNGGGWGGLLPAQAEEEEKRRQPPNPGSIRIGVQLLGEDDWSTGGCLNHSYEVTWVPGFGGHSEVHPESLFIIWSKLPLGDRFLHQGKIPLNPFIWFKTSNSRFLKPMTDALMT